MKKVIAIDGPSGAGKSTIAKELARRLGFNYLDTGALYRAVALGFREKGIKSEASDDDLKKALSEMEIKFAEGRVFLNGKDVSEEIRLTEIGHHSSIFSARKVVREFLYSIQRSAAAENNLVAEGRDMATVVFPDAWKKFYIYASPEERAKRRYLQLKEKCVEINKAEAEKDITERDKRDSSRSISPLKRADDAIFIDTSNMSINTVLENIIGSLKAEL